VDSRHFFCGRYAAIEVISVLTGHKTAKGYRQGWRGLSVRDTGADVGGQSCAVICPATLHFVDAAIVRSLSNKPQLFGRMIRLRREFYDLTGGYRLRVFFSWASAAESFRSRCGSVRGAPECSSQASPIIAPQVLQGTDNISFGVSSLLFT
jgi:hypothetical protein